MIALREYQSRRVAEIADAITRLAPDRHPDRLVVLTAPTGAGKTVILAAALDRAARDIATLWLTPGKGGLADQTAAALRGHLEGSPLTVDRLTETWLSTNPALEPGTVLVANWESLTQTSTATGGRKNRLTRDGEQRNIFRALEATADAGTPLVVVIDESHWGITATGTSDLLAAIEAIAPPLRIEASATPTRQTNPEGRGAHRHVDAYIALGEVIDEGMLSTEVRVNTGLQDALDSLADDEVAGVTGEALVLDAALTRQSELAGRYQERRSPVRPLILVQLPDGAAGSDKLASVEAHLASKGIDRANGRLAVWLSEDKTPDLDLIARNDATADVLVFKQAVATGWDCPRAQILVAFREMRSTIFAVQTVGRILRTPERRHYADAELDAAYIYANIDAPTGPTNAEPGRPPAADVTLARQVPELALAATYASRAGSYADLKPAAFRTAFAAAATTLELTSKLPTEPLRATAKLATDRTVATTDVLDGDDKITDAGTASVAVAVAGHDLQATFDRLLAGHLGGYRGKARSLSVMRQTLYDWARQQMPTWWTGDDADLIVTVQALASSHAEVLGAVLDAAVAAHRDADVAVEARRIEPFTWRMPTTLQVSSETHEQPADATGYAYADAAGAAWTERPSQPEVAVATLLASESTGEGSVRWWWKQGDGDRRWLSAGYQRPDGSVDTAYPDFVAELAPVTDGRRRLAILEAKAVGDNDPDTAHKAAALAALASTLRRAGFDVIAGIVAPLAGGLALNDGTSYTNPTRSALTGPASGWRPLDAALRDGV